MLTFLNFKVIVDSQTSVRNNGEQGAGGSHL
jgi:hypothetical protein